METLTTLQKKDLKVLADFIGVYCRNRHEAQEECVIPADLQGVLKKSPRLCGECRSLLDYALTKRRKCPLDPKPSCKHCHIHCYGKDYRAKIKEIMAFSGRKMIMRGRLDYLWHYFF